MGEVVIAVAGLVTAALGLDYIHIIAASGWDQLDWKLVVAAVFDESSCVGRQGNLPGWDYYCDIEDDSDHWVIALEVNLTPEGVDVLDPGRADG